MTKNATQIQRNNLKYTPDVPDRSNETSKIGEDFSRFNIGLETIDEVIIKFMSKKVIPNLYQNNQIIEVDLQFANPELYETIQEDGYYRDKNGKLLYPIIVINRSNVEPNNSFIPKIDGLNQLESMYFIRESTVKDNYGKERVHKEYLEMPFPDYVTITYECTALTNYRTHQNKITESVLYANNAYWGQYDENPHRFLTKVQTFSDSSEVNLMVDAYLIQDTMLSNQYRTVVHNMNHVSLNFNIK